MLPQFESFLMGKNVPRIFRTYTGCPIFVFAKIGNLNPVVIFLLLAEGSSTAERQDIYIEGLVD